MWPKAADLIVMPTKLRKRDTALMDPEDSSSDETAKEIDEAGEDCSYKPTKVRGNSYEKVCLYSVTDKSCILADRRMTSIR